MSSNFFIGIFLFLIGILYGFWNLLKDRNEYENTFSKVDSVNSWSIVIVLIVLGLIMIIKYF